MDWKPGLKPRASGLRHPRPGPSLRQAQAKPCLGPGLFGPGWAGLRAWGPAWYNTTGVLGVRWALSEVDESREDDSGSRALIRKLDETTDLTAGMKHCPLTEHWWKSQIGETFFLSCSSEKNRRNINDFPLRNMPKYALLCPIRNRATFQQNGYYKFKASPFDFG